MVPPSVRGAVASPGPAPVPEVAARHRRPARAAAPAPPPPLPAPRVERPAELPFRREAAELERQRVEIDRAIREAARGRTFSPVEILALQAKVYDYGQSLELVSHLVDRMVSAVKTTLNTQV